MTTDTVTGNKLIARLDELHQELRKYTEEQTAMGSKADYQDMVTVFFLLKIVQLENMINTTQSK